MTSDNTPNQYHVKAIELTKALIRQPSVTPEDADCQKMMNERLAKCGFDIESLFFVDTQNTWARRGKDGPVFCFAGHTDVVPSGLIDDWLFDPFTPTEHQGKLYGRGSADMKASLAAMVVATERFVVEHPTHKGSIAFLITSDEEGPFINGTTKVIDTLEARDEKITWCLVGEPSSVDTLGDVAKVGRRGSLSGYLTIKGKQGHVAYPHLAKNPVHLCAKAIDELANTIWDEGNAFFPPTTFQISNIKAGTGAGNVIPGQADIDFNLRYSTQVTSSELKARITKLLDSHNLDYEIKFKDNGLPFLTQPAALTDALNDAVSKVTGITPQLLTTGGTSDGRFIAPTGAQVIELGPCNSTIHQVNEHVELDDIGKLTDIYYHLLTNLLL